jgi:integrase
MTPIAPLITSFLQDYMPRQRGYSLQTCETYAVSFKLLLEYAATRTGTRPSRLAIEQLDAPLIVAFLAYIEQERGNGAATRNLRLAAIRSFMRYVEHHVPSALAQVGRIEAIPVKRRDQKLIRHLTMEEIRAILNAPDVTTPVGCVGPGDDAPLLRRRPARLRACRRPAGKYYARPNANRDGSRQGPQGALPASLEGDSTRRSSMAERAR